MKRNIINLLGVLVLLFTAAGCSKKHEQAPESQGNRLLTIHVTDNGNMRSIVKDLNSKGVAMTWEYGRFDLHVIVRQGSETAWVKNLEILRGNTYESATFEVEIPENINLEQPYDLIGVMAKRIHMANGKVMVGVEGHGLYSLTSTSSNNNTDVPMYFAVSGVNHHETSVDATFKHLGSLFVLSVINTSDRPLRTAGFAVIPTASTATPFYHKAALPFVGTEKLPYIDILAPDKTPEEMPSEVKYPEVILPAGEVTHMGFWAMPNGNNAPETQVVIYNADTRMPIIADKVKAAGKAFAAGMAYNIYAEWDGTTLKLLDKAPENPLPVDNPSMTISTALKPGDKISMLIGTKTSANEKDVWVDLNNNHVREAGEYVTSFSNDLEEGRPMKFTLGASTITVYGRVSTLSIPQSQLTAINVGGNPGLDVLNVQHNQLTQLDFSGNARLRRLLAEDNKLTSIKFATGSVMEELYLTHNALQTIDLSAMPDVLAYDLSNNKLTGITVPAKFTTLFISSFENNQLPATEINKIYTSLQETGEKYYDWMYCVYSFGNPGTATASHSIAKSKGWTVFDTKPDSAAVSGKLTALTALKMYLKTHSR